MANRVTNLKRLLAPKTVAVVGGRTAAVAIRQCRAIGFAGEIWPVNPTRDQIEGLHCYPSIDALPTAPDATFIAVPREETIAVVDALGRREAGGAVCYAAGFAEVGGEGIALQAQLVAAARDMALIGPNCYGMLNYLDGAALWPDRHGGQRVERGVAILTQSGNIGLNLTMQRRGLPIAYLIAVGNKAAADLHEYVDALLDDPRVTAIGLHIEGLDDVHAFSVAARRALKRGVPLVALKAGSSAIGARLTMSHTSSLAGADALYDALFDRLGIARVHDLADLVETLKLLHTCGPLGGRRIASISCSGGEASLVADLAQAHGLALPPLSEAVAAPLRELLTARVHVANPLDYQTFIWGNPAAMTACFGGMMQADVDLTLLVLDFPREDRCDAEGWPEAVAAFVAARHATGKPAAIVSSLPETLPETLAQQLVAQGVVPLNGLTDAMTAIAAAAQVGLRRREADRVQPIAPPGPAPTGAGVTLDEVTAKQALAAHGLAIPPARQVSSTEAAVAAADAIGYPVVVKAVSATLAHKTEAGAVKLGLADANAVRQAVEAMRPLSDRFLVERMARGGVAELIVGITRDPQFGLTLTVGAGGVLVELLADAVTLLLPARRADLADALQRLACYPLLTGYRGRPAGDLNAVLDAIEAIVRYAEAERGRLLELDVNPLIVLPDGAVAVDALIRLGAT